MISIICKILTFAVMAFFGYVVIEILMSNNLTNGEKLASLVCFLLLESFLIFSIVAL